MLPCVSLRQPLIAAVLSLLPGPLHSAGFDKPDAIADALAATLLAFGDKVTAEEIRKCLPEKELTDFIDSIKSGVMTIMTKNAGTMSQGLRKIGSAGASLAKASGTYCGSQVEKSSGKFEKLSKRLERASQETRGFYHMDCFHMCDGSEEMDDCLNRCDVFSTLDDLEVDRKPLGGRLRSFMESWKKFAKNSKNAPVFGQSMAILLAAFGGKDEL
mmetsp:Transcript_113979/g.179420  ORF Transcript_113979/g.179420 Transcript_113979/m.179420 type:complete len:215 (+) Transcript_113979:57-701(+)